MPAPDFKRRRRCRATIFFLPRKLLDFLVHVLLLPDFSDSGAISLEPIMWAVILGQLLSAAFLVIVLGWKGIGSAKEGFQARATVGAMMSLAFGLSMYLRNDGWQDHDRRRRALLDSGHC